VDNKKLNWFKLLDDSGSEVKQEMVAVLPRGHWTDLTLAADLVLAIVRVLHGWRDVRAILSHGTEQQ
jgi:hypothetical protein